MTLLSVRVLSIVHRQLKITGQSFQLAVKCNNRTEYWATYIHTPKRQSPDHILIPKPLITPGGALIIVDD